MKVAGREIAFRRRIPPVPPRPDTYPAGDVDAGEVEASAAGPRRGMRQTVTAAAARFIGRRKRDDRAANKRAAWQSEAWDRFDDTPEVRFAATWIGNAMSRAVLKAGVVGPTGEIEDLPEGHPALDLVVEIAGGPDGQAQMLKQFGPHLVVAGEGWIVIEPPGDTTDSDDLEWHVLSVDEVKPDRAGVLTALIDDREVIVPGDDANDDDPIAIRVWDPSPRRHIEADSPIRSSLELLEELKLLNASVKAIARSRLVGRGVLAVPHGARFPSKVGEAGEEDDLLDVFMEVAETAYKDPESAAATVPIILEVPADVIGAMEHLTFESNFDEIALKLREEAIRRFATSLDTPAEILLGMGSVNHWGVWALNEEAIRLAVEPRLSLVADALTRQWIRPLLETMSVEDASRVVVYADTAPLRVRSNRAQTALELRREGVISETALRRETGFDEEDAPTKDELARELLVKLLLSSPDWANVLLPLLGIDITGLPTTTTDTTTDTGAGSGGESETVPDGLPVDETGAPPATDPASTPAVADPTQQEATV